MATYLNGHFRAAELKKINDYIKKPKADGYRSIHLIYAYKSSHASTSIYSWLKIEL